MKPCTYCGRQNEDDTGRCRECGTQFADPSPDTNAHAPWSAGIESLVGMFSDLVPDLDAKRRWLVCFVGLTVLAVGVILLLSRDGRKAVAPRIVVLATWSTNGKQFVTFRPDPPTAEITYADLVSAATDGKTQPPIERSSSGLVFPLRNAWETNHSLRFVAVPRRTAAVPGKPLVAYTPGSCTVSYTPTDSDYRVRVGVALEQKRAEDYIQRLRNCWKHRRLAMLRMQSYQHAYFVIIDPLTEKGVSH